MSNFPLEKYRYYVDGNRVIAVSTYCGKTVRGVAVCHPVTLSLVSALPLLSAMRELLLSVLSVLVIRLWKLVLMWFGLSNTRMPCAHITMMLISLITRQLQSMTRLSQVFASKT